MAPDAEAERCAEQGRPGVLTSAFWRRFGPPCLLLRNLYARGAFIAVQEVREIFSLVGVDPDNHPGLTPGLFE